MLPGEMMVVRVEENALGAAGIVDHRRAQLAAIGAVDNEGADGIGAEVDADGVGHGLSLYRAERRRSSAINDPFA